MTARPVSDRSFTAPTIRALLLMAGLLTAAAIGLPLGHHLWNYAPKEGDR